MNGKDNMELHKKIDDTQNAVKDTKDALHAINNMLTKVLLKNEEIANRAREENTKQFERHCQVLNVIQRTQEKMQEQIDIQYKEIQEELSQRKADCVELSTLHSSRDRYLFAMGGFAGVFALVCGYIFTSTITGVNAHFDKNDAAIISNDAKHNATEDKLSDEISELQEFKRGQINVNLH